MKLFSIKKSVSIIALGLAAVLGTSVAANAQGNRNHDQKKDIQNQQSVIQQQNQQRNRGQQDRGRGQQQREPDWTDRGQINPPRQIGGGFYNVHPNPVVNNTPRYRVYRNGGWYNTDNRGADLLRQAVNAGYQQGYAAGRADRNSRRGSSWGNNTIYRSGTYGWQSYVDRGQYQYYFQQGFQRGYQDGYNSRYQYGFNNGGSVGILGSILGSILNIQSY